MLNANNIISEGLSANYASIIYGGYCKVGKIVVVNIRIQTNQSVNGQEIIIHGLPKAKDDNYNTIALRTNRPMGNTYCQNNQSELELRIIPEGVVEAGTTYLIGCTYITV